MLADEAKRVIVSGSGGTRELALNNAFRHAVEQAVGLMVSSESYVKNLKDIKDKILMTSDGFIESYEVVNEEKDVTGYAVTISAVVREKKLNATVKNLSGATTKFDGGSAYANLVLSDDKAQDYHDIIIKAIDDLIEHGFQFRHEPPQVYEGRDGYYLYLGDVDITLNKHWEKSAAKYRNLLGGSSSGEEYRKALRGFPDPLGSFTRYGAADISGWLVATIDVKDKGGDVIQQKRFPIGEFSNLGFDSCNNTHYFSDLFGFKDPKLNERKVHFVSVRPRKPDDHCNLEIGPFDKEDIANINSIDFTIQPREDYGGKIQPVKYDLKR